MLRFILQGFTDQPIMVYGDGKRTRSFCYIGGCRSRVNVVNGKIEG